MARFWKELKYTLRMRKHLFFMLMIIIGLVSAVYLFRESLESSLEKAFPNDYGTVTKATKQTYHIKGSYADHSTAKDVDIQAELTINRSLHEAAWMEYEEGFLSELYVKDYSGPKEAVVGNVETNMAVEMDKGKYGKVQSAWLSQEVLEREGFGSLTSRMFSSASTYTETLYVMLGAGMAGGKYDAGTELTLRMEGVKVAAKVLGFLDPGTTMYVGSEPVCLDFYVVCPLLDLSDLYGGAGEEDLPTNIDPIYLKESQFSSGAAFADTETSRRELERDNVHYMAAKCLWITDEDIDALEEVPSWLQTLRNIKVNGNATLTAWFGNAYKEAGISRGTNLIAMTLYDGRKTVVCNGFVPEGETFKLGDKTINLDEYIVIGLKKVENANTTDASADKGENSSDKEQDSFTVELRTLLFRLLVKKNSGVIRTKYTADESQRNLEKILEGAWENYQKDNPNIERTSTYYVKEADKPGSVIYNDEIREYPAKLKKVDRIGYFVGIVLLLLYLVYKFFKSSDYFTALVLTGDMRIEIILLFLAEVAILYVFACGLAFGLSWLVCKLLGLSSVVIKPILEKNLRIVAIPFAVVSLIVLFKDYGKIFRRR